MYMEHPTTAPLSLVFAVDGSNPYLIPAQDHSLETATGNALHELAENQDTIFVAHNAAFEQNFWRVIMVGWYGFPEIPVDRWKCTMAKAYAHGLPGSLDGACKALHLPMQKDDEGHKLMMKLSRPRRDGTLYKYDDCPDDFERLYEYNVQDVIAERGLDNALRDLQPKERRIWQIDQRMNQNGILFDIPLVAKAMEFGELHATELHKEFKDATGGEAGTPRQRAKFKTWLQVMGVPVKDTKAATVRGLLEREDIADDVRAALRCMGDANKTSLGKLPTILARSTPDGKCREYLNYYAAHTGRWGGKGVQIQNLPRSHNKFIRPCIQALQELGYESFKLIYPDVSSALSASLRGLIIPHPGYRFLVADFSQMEARVLAWLAGQQDVLDLFAAGEDLYCYAASDIYGREITKDDKDERQVGKVAVLALGYGGGINAFAEMAATYNVNLRPVFEPIWQLSTHQERENAEKAYMLYLKRKTENPVSKEVAFVSDIIKQRWRIGNDKIAAYWKDLEHAVVEAMKTGKPVAVGASPVTWFINKEFLFCKLPGGRFLAYPYPRLTENSRGGISISYISATKGRIGTYGGKLAENLTQAVQRDLLAEALIRLEDKYPVAFHVHDEMISEMPDGEGSLDEFMDIIREVPQWAKGIPIDVTGWEGSRYGKE